MVVVSICSLRKTKKVGIFVIITMHQNKERIVTVINDEKSNTKNRGHGFWASARAEKWPP